MTLALALSVQLPATPWLAGASDAQGTLFEAVLPEGEKVLGRLHGAGGADRPIRPSVAVTLTHWVT